MKIVLDTNIVVSGLLHSEGNPARVLTLSLSGAVQVCHDERILAEYAEVLARPHFKFDPERVREVLEKLEADGLAVDASGESSLDLPDAGSRINFRSQGNPPRPRARRPETVHHPPNKRRGCAVVSPAAFIEHWRKLQDEN